jgi:hypothetical protein
LFLIKNEKIIKNKIILHKMKNFDSPEYKSLIESLVSSETKTLGLTHVKDVDLKMLMMMDDRSLLNFCIADKYVNDLCNDEKYRFWETRFINRFGLEAAKYKPINRSWKNHYLKVISDLEIFSKDKWAFFKLISWNLRDEIQYKKLLLNYTYRLISISKAPEDIKNIYWLLNLGDQITLVFPAHEDIDTIKRTYRSPTYFTPASVLKLVKDFYNEKLTQEELEEQIENYGLEDFSLEDVGSVRRIDILGEPYFKGFRKTKKGNYFLKIFD